MTTGCVAGGARSSAGATHAQDELTLFTGTIGECLVRGASKEHYTREALAGRVYSPGMWAAALAAAATAHTAERRRQR